MTKIDIDRFICSLIERQGVYRNNHAISELQIILGQQGLHYRNGEIVEIEEKTSSNHKPIGRFQTCPRCGGLLVYDNPEFDWYKCEQCGKITPAKELRDQPPLTEEQKAKFKVGDWVVDYLGNIIQIIDIYPSFYKVKEPDQRTYNYDFESVEEDCHLWTIQDAKPGDVLMYEGYYNSIVLFHGIGLNGEGHINYYCKCDLTDYNVNIQGDVAYMGDVEDCAKYYHPATKEQRDLLFQKMEEAGYEWDADKKELSQSKVTKISDQEWSEEDEKYVNDLTAYFTSVVPLIHTEEDTVNWLNSLKDRVQSQPKQEWSEEDEEILKELTKFIPYHLTAHSYNQYYNWAISHRPQPHWKPSEEQMNALKHASNDCSIAFADMKILATLYEQLKALHRYEQDT